MRGTVTTGRGDAAGFVAAVADALAAELGFTPFHGTLNLETGDSPDESVVVLEEFGDDHCDGIALSRCRVGGVRGAVVRPIVPDYPETKVEIVAPIHLRSLFGIDPGDRIDLAVADEAWPPADIGADPDSLGSFDAVVFDLDRTLLTLDVDWEDVFEDVQALLAPVADRPVTEYGENELYAVAREHGLYDELDGILQAAELEGANRATRLPALGVVGELDCPVGVCTANAVPAAERALEPFGALDSVDAIVGRTTVEKQKPDPAPLVECFDRLGVSPGDGVFVGDRETDAGAAVGAETSFLHPSQLWDEQ